MDLKDEVFDMEDPTDRAYSYFEVLQEHPDPRSLDNMFRRINKIKNGALVVGGELR